MITTQLRSSALICRSTSMPLGPPGIWMSRMTTLGRHAKNSRKALLPSEASPTISTCGNSESSPASRSRINAESSATKTLSDEDDVRELRSAVDSTSGKAVLTVDSGLKDHDRREGGGEIGDGSRMNPRQTKML